MIFDIGSTLYHPIVDTIIITQQFLETVDSSRYRKIPEQLIRSAYMTADKWLDRYMLENNVESLWNPSPQIWFEYNKHVLRGLGVDDELDRLALEYQQLWMSIDPYNRRKIYDGVIETLHRITESGRTIAIASNRFEDPSSFLDKDGILSLFAAIEYSNVPGYRKPSPYMLLCIAHRLGVNPRLCAYVGNTVKEDVEAARRAEMLPILIRWTETEEEPLEHIPDNTVVISDIREILNILDDKQ